MPAAHLSLTVTIARYFAVYQPNSEPYNEHLEYNIVARAFSKLSFYQFSY